MFEGFIEINCSVMGTDSELKASICEQPVSWGTFLTLDDKHMRSGSNK